MSRIHYLLREQQAVLSEFGTVFTMTDLEVALKKMKIRKASYWKEWNSHLGVEMGDK